MCLLERLQILQSKEPSLDLTMEVKKLIEDARKLKDNDVYQSARLLLADTYLSLKKFDQACKHYNVVISMLSGYETKKLKLDTINKAIICCKYIAFKSKMYVLLREKQRLLKELGLTDLTLFKDLAFAEYELKKYTRSIYYYNEALKTDLTREQRSQVYSQLAKVYITTKQHAKALEVLYMAKDVATKINDVYGMITNRHMIAQILIERKDYDNALDILQDVEKDLMSLSKRVTLLPVITLLELLIKLDKTDEAKFYIEKYSLLFEKDQNIKLKKQYYDFCLEVYTDADSKMIYLDKLHSLLSKALADTSKLEESLHSKIDEYESTKKDGEELFGLITNIDKTVEFIGSLDNQLSFRDMFMMINNHLSQILDFDESTIIRIKQYEEKFPFYHYKKGRVYDRIKLREEFDNTIFDKVFVSKKEIICTNAFEFAELKEPFSEKTNGIYGVTSLLVHPLIDHTNNSNELIGMLAFYLKDGKKFDKNTVQAFLKIVSQLYTAKLINIDYSHNASSLKDVYEVALSNTDTGIVSSKNFIHFDVSNHLFSVLGLQGRVSYEQLLSSFEEKSRNQLDKILKDIQYNNYEVNVATVNLHTVKKKFLKVDFNVKKVEDNFAFISMKISDNTQQKGELDTYSNLAFSDKLTQLRNRASLMQKLDELKTNGKKFSYLMTDLNGFKGINDTYGHEVGDDVLITVGECLRKVFKEEKGHYPFRQSGDEFVVILEDEVSKPTINNLVKEYIKELKKGHPMDLVTIIPLKTSVGIVRYPTDVKRIDKVNSYADAAMYAVKAKKLIEPDNNYKYFEKTDLEKEQTQDPRKILGLDLDEIKEI